MKTSTFYARLQRTLRDRSSSPEALLQQLLQNANEYLQSPVGFIYLHDPDAQYLIFHLGYNCNLEDLEHSVLSIANSASGQVIREKVPTEFANIQGNGQYLCQEFARKHGVNRYFALPLLDASQSVIGVLGLHPLINRPIAHVERENALSIARVIAFYLDALRRQQREAQVHRLARLGNMLTTRGSLRTIPVALEQVRQSVEAEQVYYFEVGKSETHHVAKDHGALNVQQSQIWRLAQQSLSTKLPVLEKSSHTSAPGTQVFLTASSLTIQSKPEGCLVFVNTFTSLDVPVIPYLSKDSRLVALVATLFEIFLENLRYLDSLRAEEERRHSLTLCLSHEFLIPITGLASRVERLKKACSPFFGERDRAVPPFVYFDDMRHALEDLQELTTGILSLTEESCNFKPCHIFGSIFLRVHDLLKHQALRRGIEIAFDQREFVDNFPKTMMDKTLVTHVLYNVLKNAIKYSYKDTPIRVRAWSTGRHRGISVDNWGIGVPQGEAELIFEPFRQGSNAHSVNVRGAGIGLHICRRIMRLHNGDIFLQQSKGPTIFTVQFPI